MKISKWQNIPFYGNTPDNTHCNQAGLKMILGYYFPDEQYSWEELDKFSGKKPNKWTWPMKGWLYLSKRGLKVTYYGTFDYKRFVKEGGAYLIHKYGKEVGEAQITHSDLPYEIEVSKNLINLMPQIKKIPTIDDIKKYLIQECLVLCNVNYYSLYRKKGYSGHFVLIYGIDDKYVYLQDPGLPPNQNASIPLEDFIVAWEYGGIDNKGLTVIKKD